MPLTTRDIARAAARRGAAARHSPGRNPLQAFDWIARASGTTAHTGAGAPRRSARLVPATGPASAWSTAGGLPSVGPAPPDAACGRRRSHRLSGTASSQSIQKDLP